MRLLPLLSLLLAIGLPAQITARIDDPLSHGTLGDTKLSVDEAIRLSNGTLQISALSAAEQARLSGVSGVVETIRIDAAVTPVITLERVLTDVIGQHHAHVHVEFDGMNGPNGPPVLDAGMLPIGLPLRTNHAHVHNLIVRGGMVGIEFDTTLHYHPSEIAELGHVHLEHQHMVGLRIVNPATNGMQAPIMLHDVHIHETGIGIEVVDRSAFGNVDVSGEHVEIAHCDVGVKVMIDSTGGDHLVALGRSSITAVDHGVVVERVSAASDSRWRFRFVHGTYRALDTAFAIASTAAGRTVVELHHLQVQGGVGTTNHALRAGPQAAHLALVATECAFRAPVSLAAGAAGSMVRLYNDRFEGGALSLGFSTGSGDLQWNNFTSFPITIEAASTSLPAPITFDACELVRSDVMDLSAGRSLLTACFLGGSVLSSNVQNQRPQLAPWIGRAAVTPRDPPVGTYVDLHLDLHPGTAAVWLLGGVLPAPITTSMPLRFYFDLSTSIVLPGVYQLTTRTRLPIPDNPRLVGESFYLQPVQVPLQGQPYVPPVFLPTGAAIHID